jgi:hypothetical protein
MSPIEHLNRRLPIEHLTAQIRRLSDQQSVATQKAVFARMTEEETKGYDERSARNRSW